MITLIGCYIMYEAITSTGQAIPDSLDGEFGKIFSPMT